MLYNHVTTHREAIIKRTTQAATGRASPIATGLVENGVPRFLSQLSETLLNEGRGRVMPGGRDVAIGESASRHGAELLALGFTVSKVVHAYGDICQAVTETAMANNTSISVEEFQILNRCLDEAIAEALTEHARLTAIRWAMFPGVRGLSCPRCKSPTTEVVALRSSSVADEHHFRCNGCNHQWTEIEPPNNAAAVRRTERRLP